MKSLPSLITVHILKMRNKNKVVMKEHLLLNIQGTNNLNSLCIYEILSSEEINSLKSSLIYEYVSIF